MWPAPSPFDGLSRGLSQRVRALAKPDPHLPDRLLDSEPLVAHQHRECLVATDEAAPVFDWRPGDLAVELDGLADPAGDDEAATLIDFELIGSRGMPALLVG